jgi:hypothetical protein
VNPHGGQIPRWFGISNLIISEPQVRHKSWSILARYFTDRVSKERYDLAEHLVLLYRHDEIVKKLNPEVQHEIRRKGGVSCLLKETTRHDPWRLKNDVKREETVMEQWADRRRRIAKTLYDFAELMEKAYNGEEGMSWTHRTHACVFPLLIVYVNKIWRLPLPTLIFHQDPKAPQGYFKQT